MRYRFRINRYLFGWAFACVVVGSLCLVYGPALLFWLGFDLELQVMESKAQYHFRMLRYHGRETKDVKKQSVHARALVACGGEAVPLLIDDIRFFRCGRYDPGPYELLRRIGKDERWQVIEALRKLSASQGAHRVPIKKQRLALITALVVAYDEFADFGTWLELVQDPSLSDRSLDVFSLLNMMQGYLEQSPQFKGAPPLLADDHCPTCPINPRFLEWWWKAEGQFRNGAGTGRSARESDEAK